MSDDVNAMLQQRVNAAAARGGVDAELNVLILADRARKLEARLAVKSVAFDKLTAREAELRAEEKALRGKETLDAADAPRLREIGKEIGATLTEQDAVADEVKRLRGDLEAMRERVTSAVGIVYEDGLKQCFDKRDAAARRMEALKRQLVEGLANLACIVKELGGAGRQPTTYAERAGGEFLANLFLALQDRNDALNALAWPDESRFFSIRETANDAAAALAREADDLLARKQELIAQGVADALEQVKAMAAGAPGPSITSGKRAIRGNAAVMRTNDQTPPAGPQVGLPARELSHEGYSRGAPASSWRGKEIPAAE